MTVVPLLLVRRKSRQRLRDLLPEIHCGLNLVKSIARNSAGAKCFFKNTAKV